jgi:hypothetical protein
MKKKYRPLSVHLGRLNMSLDHIPPNIEQGVQRFAEAQHISHDEALLRILENGLTLIEGSVRPEDPELGFGHGRAPRKPNLDVAEKLPIIGMFPNDPDFNRTMDAIIAGRSQRYSL